MGMDACLAVILAALACLPAPAAPERAAVAQESKEKAADEVVPQLMEAVGVLAGFQLYQTYLNIGFLADGKTEGVYKDSDVKQLLASIMKPLGKVDQQLEKVGKLAQTRADREAAAKLRKIAILLREQGKALETFWTSDKPADGMKYESTRKQAWTEISALLGLDK